MVPTIQTLPLTCPSMCAVFGFGVFFVGKVPCPSRPLARVAPVPPTPPVIAIDASEVKRVAAKTIDDVTVDAYDQHIADFSEALSTYRDAQTTYTQWCDEDVLWLFSLLVFCPILPRSLWALLLSLRCGITFAHSISPLVTLSTYLWSVRTMLSIRVTPVLRSSTHRVLLFGVNLTPSNLLSVGLAHVSGP
jgi:hypothetical protein